MLPRDRKDWHDQGMTRAIVSRQEQQMKKQPTEDDFTVVEVLESGVVFV